VISPSAKVLAAAIAKVRHGVEQWQKLLALASLPFAIDTQVRTNWACADAAGKASRAARSSDEVVLVMGCLLLCWVIA
jgi:hypothetical protein